MEHGALTPYDSPPQCADRSQRAHVRARLSHAFFSEYRERGGEHGATFRKPLIPGQGACHFGNAGQSLSLAAREFCALFKQHIEGAVKPGIFLRELEIGFREFGRCRQGTALLHNNPSSHRPNGLSVAFWKGTSDPTCPDVEMTI